MPPNPQICLLNAANFIVLTPWVQGASERKISIHSPPPVLSQALSSVPRSIHPRLGFDPVVKIRGSWVKNLLSQKFPGSLGPMLQAYLWTGQCLNLQVHRSCPSLESSFSCFIFKKGKKVFFHMPHLASLWL